MKIEIGPLAIAFVAVMVAGCANPKVVEIAPGIYDLSREDHGGIFGNPDALKASVINDANKFAKRNSEVAIPIFSKFHPVGVLGDWASFDYQFKLVPTNSPEVTDIVSMTTEEKKTGGDGTALRPESYVETYYHVETATNDTVQK